MHHKAHRQIGNVHHVACTQHFPSKWEHRMYGIFRDVWAFDVWHAEQPDSLLFTQNKHVGSLAGWCLVKKKKRCNRSNTLTSGHKTGQHNSIKMTAIKWSLMLLIIVLKEHQRFVWTTSILCLYGQISMCTYLSHWVATDPSIHNCFHLITGVGQADSPFASTCSSSLYSYWVCHILQ